MGRTGIVADARVKRHDPGLGHPEQPARFDAIIERLQQTGLLHQLTAIEARSATHDDLALVHTREYIALTEREVSQGRLHLSTGDTDLSASSTEAARLAAGSVLAATDAVFSRDVDNAFCVLRPPGHHANASVGMGFCLYNNVAIGARYAQHRCRAARILIADWDVHHGNGTQDIFYSDGSVLFFSTHQSPWYPGTGAVSERGEGAGAGKTINCPFPAFTPADKILGAFREVLLPAAREFHPDCIFLSAGFDSRIDDPLGHFLLTDHDFAELTRMMTGLAADACNARLISVLEGGYNLNGLARAAEAHVRGLLA